MAKNRKRNKKLLFILPTIVLLLILSIFVMPFKNGNTFYETTINYINKRASANWYTEYTYTLNSSAKTITLTKYNGTAEVVEIPATATISGTTYKTIVIGNSNHTLSLFAGNRTIKKVTFANGVKGGNTLRGLFYNCPNLEEVNFNSFDTSSVTNMSAMFLKDKSLKKVNVSSFNTTNVTTFNAMFQECSSLEELDISSFSTRHITTERGMDNMFESVYYLKKFIVGPNVDFHATIDDPVYGRLPLRGVYTRINGDTVEDVEAVDLFLRSGTEDVSGTYIRKSDITDYMSYDTTVTYRIDNFNTIESYVQAPNTSLAFENNMVVVKNIPKPNVQDYHPSWYFVMVFDDAVVDSEGNRYKLRVRYDNAHIYNLNEATGSRIWIKLFEVNKGLLAKYYAYTDEAMENIIDGTSYIKADLTIEILDDNYNPVQGNYIFSASDLDTNEGLYLLEGLSDIKKYRHTYLTTNGNFIVGTHHDEQTEMSEFVAIADASKVKVTYQVRNLSTKLLSYYQPRQVTISKRDIHNSILPGSKLVLYKGDNPFIEEWTTSGEDTNYFLNPGSYTLKEVNPPPGYKKASDITFYVNTNDTIYFDGNEVDEIVMTDEYESYNYTINYINEDTNEIFNTITNQASYKDIILAAPFITNIPKYTFSRADKNQIEISYQENNNVINLYYKKNKGTVIVKYIETGTDHEIANRVTITDYVDKRYETHPATVTGYDLFKEPDNKNGYISETPTTVTYEYTKRPATLIVKYVDEQGNDIDPSKNINDNTKHWGDEYQTNQLTFTNYTYLGLAPNSDSASGTIGKDTITVIYRYHLKEATLIVKYVDEQNNDIDPSKNISDNTKHWGDEYQTNQLTFTNYNYIGLAPNSDSASGTIGKDTVSVIYRYRLKGASLIIKYVDEQGNDIDPSKNIIDNTKHWGDSYTSEQLNFPNYDFLRIEGVPNGTIGANTVEVRYIYRLKEATIVTHHYIKGTTDRISPDDTQTIKYTKPYSTSKLNTTNLDYEYDSKTGDDESGTVTKSNYEVTYFYRLKKGQVITHHYKYENGAETTKKVVDDVIQEIEYTKNYETKNPDNIPGNYEFYKKSNNYTGTLRQPVIDVYYYYQLKDSQVTSNINVEGTELITDKGQVVNYEITYNAEIVDYIGDGTITIIDTLPYDIDVEKSNLAEGSYNPTNRTITWTEEWPNINSTTEPDLIARKTIVKNISIVYLGIDSRDRIMTNEALGAILLSTGERTTEDQNNTDIRIGGNIIVKYVDENGKNILDNIVNKGLVGETVITNAREKEGYILVKKPEVEEYTFEDDEQIVTYIYQKIKLQITTKVIGDGGTITGDEEVYYGEDSTKGKIVITPDDKYSIDKILVNGKRVELSNIKQFKNMTEDIIVEVKFMITPNSYEEVDNPDTNKLNIKFISILVLLFVIIIALTKTIFRKRLSKI